MTRIDSTAAGRFAIIGCGRMGRAHGQRLSEDARGEVVALCDPDLTMARQLNDNLPGKLRLFATADELLEHAELDAVVICTPTTAHRDQVLACRERGLAVLCEKPLAESRERIRELVSAVEVEGPIASLAYQRRYWSSYRTLKREVESGRWGAVRSVTSHNVEHWQQAIAGTWRDDPQVNIGGFVGDAGSHKIDIVFYVTGLAPVEVFARSWKCGSRVEVISSVSAILDGDVPLCMDFVGNAQYLGEDFHVHCERADLMIRDREVWIAENNHVHRIDNVEPDSNPTIGFLDLLEGRSENIAPFSCALPVFNLTEAILESSRSGRSVAVRQVERI